MNDSALFEDNNNNNNDNDNEFQQKINFNKNDILSLIEKAFSDRDKAISNYTNLQVEYNNLQNDYNSLKSKLNSMELFLQKANSKSLYSEKQLNESISKLFSSEKKLADITNQNQVLSRTNNLLEKQLSQYKTIYIDTKSRMSKELSLLQSNLEETQKEKEELMKNNMSIKRELNKYILKNKLLEQENQIIKSDNDNLIKIIEEHNEIVKTSEAKNASFDTIINDYKKQIDNLNSEIEKLKLENKSQIEQNEKNKTYFNEKSIINENNFEEALINMRNKHQKKINIKINEYNLLRADFINTKIERDKYYGDYMILKDDYEQNNKRFQEQYLDIQKEKKEKEIEMSKEIGYLNDKINGLFEENMRIKNENNDLENKVKELEVEEEVREKLEQKNREINEEVNSIKKNNEELIQENEMLKNKINELLKMDE